VKKFGPHTIKTVFYDGRPCWTIRSLEGVLGYGKVHGLTNRFQRVFKKILLKGTDYDVLRGEKLLKYKVAAEVKHLTSVLVFFEPGVVKMCSMGPAEECERFLRWLKEGVLTKHYNEKNHVCANKSTEFSVRKEAPALCSAHKRTRVKEVRDKVVSSKEELALAAFIAFLEYLKK
jgi:hypothetical protein